MCLAIPGQIVKVFDDEHYAMVDVSGVRRKINIDLVRGEGAAVGDWVLFHVGFAMSKISEQEAGEQLRLLRMLGESEEAMEEVTGYRFDELAKQPRQASAEPTKEG